MKTVLFSFRGLAGQRDVAEKCLRARLTDCRLEVGSGGALEAQLTDEQLAGLADLSDWVMTPMVWVDVSPPRVNLVRLRAKLASGR